MKPFLALFLGVLLSGVHAQTSASRERILFDADWRFQKGDPKDANRQLDYPKVKAWVMATGGELVKSGSAVAPMPAGNPGGDISCAQSAFDDSAWRLLNLPHDWGIEGPFKQVYPSDTGKRPYWGEAWYRKHFNVPADAASRRYFIDFDGAMSYSMVWLNGKFVGGWPYGYASWELDLSPYIQPGDNVIAVRLANPSYSSRWYPGGGIYRNVWLVSTSPAHVAHWGVYVTTPTVTNRSAAVQIEVHVQNGSNSEAGVVTQIYAAGPDGKAQGNPLAASQLTTAPKAGDSVVREGPIHVSNPNLWSLEKPDLYVAVTSILQDNKLVDRCQTPFGIRTIKFDSELGFLLNGAHVKINGVCNHHDLGALGAAINVRALQRQIELLKEMGCNAIRTSHNPPAPELLDLCDRMGMLVMDEFADCWELKKVPHAYTELYDDWHEKDLRALVRRDRNHPCVILWSIGNEIPEQSKPQGPAMAAELAGIVHGEDLTRPVTSACNETNSGYNGFQKAMDVFGYNYKPAEYAKFHATNPDMPLFASETSSSLSSRGEYFFPVSNNPDEGRSDFQMSSYDLYYPGWGGGWRKEFQGQDQNSFVAGEFVWTGFDYLGEPTPYSYDTKTLPNYQDPADKAKAEEQLRMTGKVADPSRSSYFGILDLAGFRKDRFYLYQAEWRPDFPMAHILPHWSWPERVGQVTPVHVYTSGDEAELFLNGQSLGRKKMQPFEYRLRWDDVVYQPGELKVIAYKNGQKWAEDSMKTAGPAAKILLKADRAALRADGDDLAFVTVTIADRDGLLVPRSKNLVHFDVSGPGELVATDNGDPTSHVSFQSADREAFNGLALAIIRTKAEPGQITLTAHADGLQPADITISTARP